LIIMGCFAYRVLHGRGVSVFSPLLLATALVFLPLTTPSAWAQSVDFQGKTFVNKGLVGVGRIPSDAKDKQGDTLGGIGSGMVANVSSWRKDGEVYRGTVYMLPDRGWNTEGSVDYEGRLQVFTVEPAPPTGPHAVPAG